jgi:hypothetical protein
MKIDPAKFGKFKAGGRGLQRQMVRLFRTWLHDPQTLDWLYGRQLSRLAMENKMRGCLGLAPLTKKDIPPGEDWETVPPHILLTRKEREERVDEILRIPSDEEEPAEPQK